MPTIQTIDPFTLREWLEKGEAVNLLDVRPLDAYKEWSIPGSTHLDVYEKLWAHDESALNALTFDKTIPVVAICARGNTSQIAADMLQRKGYKAYSLAGGMKEWSLAWNTAKINSSNCSIIQLRRTGKGCLSYIIASENEAMIIDSSLEPEVYEDILEKENLTLKYVADTHIHADHLSRGKKIAERNILPFHLPIQDKVKFKFNPIEDESIFKLGKIEIKVIAVPGHTMESVAFLIDNKFLITGDTLFIDAVGRPDLKANTEETISRAKLLYQSLQKILALDEDIIVLPAHTSHPIDFDNHPIQATLKNIKNSTSVLSLSEEDFVETILQRIPPTPANYLAIVEKNLSGDFDDINPTDLEAGANRCAVA